MKKDLKDAHQYSSNHRKSIVQDIVCGCFYCGEIFSPNKICEWIEDEKDDTAICPYCGIDSVIGESSGYPITKDFLKRMNEAWFG